MAAESLVLDGLALTSGEWGMEQLEMPPPKKRLEWAQGDDSDGGLLLRDPLFENREITCRLRVAAGASMDTALARIGALQAKFEEAERQRDGLPLVWTPKNSTKSYTLYVLTGEITGLPIVLAGADIGWFQARPVITVQMTARPFGYGTEVVGTPVSSTLPLMTVTVANVGGDVPAEARLIITDNAAQNRRHVEWGLEHRYHNAAAGLILDSDADLVTTGFAGALATRSGAYDPNASGNNVIRTTVYEETTECCGTGNQPHVGTWRAKARVYATDPDIRLRLAHQAGDGPFSYNAFTAPPAINDFAEVDLGLIHVREKRLGTQRWTGKIEAYGPAAGATLDIDCIYLIPAGEGYGKARAGGKPVGKGNLQAKDAFDSIAAGTALNARAAPLGGSWATSGAATDFAAADAPSGRETMARSTVSDASARLAALGATNYTDMRVECAVRWSEGNTGTASGHGVIARWVDANNYLRATIDPIGTLTLTKVVAGSATTLATKTFLPVANNTWYALVLTAYATGVIVVELLTGASAPIATIQAVDAVAATGGALDDGKPGIYDRHTTSGANTRYYEDFYVHKPPPEPIVCYSGQSIEFRSAGEDAALREDATGTYWGQPPQAPRGSRFYLPESGDENRPSRVAVKLRRNDIEAAADANIADSATVQINHTPRYTAVPR